MIDVGEDNPACVPHRGAESVQRGTYILVARTRYHPALLGQSRPGGDDKGEGGGKRQQVAPHYAAPGSRASAPAIPSPRSTWPTNEAQATGSKPRKSGAPPSKLAVPYIARTQSPTP